MPGARWWSLALATLAAGLLPGCARSDDSYPPAPQVVDVSMTEYRFGLEAPSSSGRIVFDARNDGGLEHELVLVGVPDNVDSIDEQLRSDKRLVVPTIARMARRTPGQRGTFAVDLDPGRYAIICFVDDGRGDQHAQKGMSAQFSLRP